MKTNKLLEFATAGLPRSVVKLSDGREVKLRAFAVKELKLLMMAHTSETSQDTQILQILDQCIETDGIDILKLPSHDIEYLYIELYKLSKGTSLVPVKYRCMNEIDGHKCNSEIYVNLNLNNIIREPEKEKRIELSNGLILNMRYPTIIERDYFTHEKEDIFNMAINCISSVDTGHETMIVGEDITKEEISEVIDYLNESSFEKMLEFVLSIPSLILKFPLKCPVCGHEEIVELRGLSDFFE